MKNKSKEEKMMQGLNDCKTTCPKCKHRMGMLPMTESAVCTYCGTKIKNKSKAKFRYEMFKRLKERKNEI